MTLLSQYSQIDHVAWEQLTSTSPVRSWFQTSEAYQFFDQFDSMESFVVAVSDNNRLMGLITGYIQADGSWLKQRLSRRAIIVGGPLLADDITSEQLAAMLNALRDNLKRRYIYIETRNLNDYSRWRDTFEKCGFKYVPHLNFHQDTSSTEAIDSELNRTRKRHIHVGLRDGATLSQATSEAEIDEFYNILSDLYRHKVRKPLPPREFFQQLCLLPSAKLLTVNYQGHIIGGMAYVALQGHVGYEWYVCGMDDSFKKLYPSELATYAGLQQAATTGCPRFDYMGAGKPGEAYGVRDFKAQFGGTLVEHGRFLRVNKPLIYGAATMALNLLGKMKAEKKTPRYIKNELPLFYHHSRRGTLAND